MKNLEFNLDALLRKNIRNIKPYSSARDEYKDITDGMLFIDANENPFNTNVNRYPDPQQVKLKSQLAELKGVSEKNILLGNGSDEVLDLIFRAFCEPNSDKIITLPPTYGMYSVLANINAVENIEIELESNFQPNTNAILEAANNQTKLLFLCSPNNPTANSFEASKIEALLNNFKGIVVIDEAYIDFSKEESWLNRLQDFPNLIVTQTLSKAYGLAGIRLGICYASDAIIAVLNRIKPPYNINQLTQDKASERLNNMEIIKDEVYTILSERELLSKKLEDVSLVEKVYLSDANFLLVKVDDATKRYNELVEKGIVVRNRTTQALCENCLRFTVGTEVENEKLIEILRLISKS
ncbi:histidinol-phosphate transaminase [Winogradskyella litoriviva]|uniref:Histidinol-phosphate aminotransferase n=1 Tax=Winogradskyella litoriviva TaxID=1220182 RepID=A0ABX2E5I1_9FLAO|nr:histidinol-phosphate transaminase [Winogradskyella litoriviva]NRD23559.1 histidinol-phosphate transaminase [Winogradskyella litoriviva]